VAVDPPFATGITFTFDGDSYTATQISVSRSAAEFDVSSTDIPASGSPLRRYRASEVENIEIKVDWVGLTIPTVDTTASFSLSTAMGATGSIALCTGLSITASAGELIRGSATFKVSKD
jgi:hypothetical protein